ncbi:tail fiber domain-containing protein [Bradyrhizobium liaoningense]
MFYNDDYNVVQFCNGADWIAMGGTNGGGGLTDGDKTDISVSGSGATWAIDSGAVSYAKIQNVSGPNKILGRFSTGAGVVEELTLGSGLSLDGSGNLTATATSLSGGTAGYLGVWTGATSLGLSSTTAGQQLFWDATNHRLGIGTASPGSKLQVSVANASNDGVAVTSANGSSIYLGPDRGAGGSNALVQAGDGSLIFSDGTAESGNFVIGPWSAGANGIRITNAGNVGIGTTSPGAKLEVRSGSEPEERLFQIRNNAGTVYYMGVKNAANGQAFYLGGNAGDTLAVTAGGNVGIGTTSPAYRLDVAGDLNSSTVYRLNNGTVSANFQLNGTSNPILNVVSNHGLEFRTGNTERMKIDAAGNVGIGTTSPAHKLHVAGVAYATSGLITDYASWVKDHGTPTNGYTRLAYWNNAFTFQDADTSFNLGTKTFSFNMSTGDMTIPGAAYKPGGGVWTASSDARLKTVDGAYSQGLESLVKLAPVRFHYKKGNARKEPSGTQFVGLIAQDVQKVFPEAVHQRGDGYLDLDATPIYFALINAVKQLKADNDNLRTELKAMNDNDEEQDAAINALRLEIDALKASLGE